MSGSVSTLVQPGHSGAVNQMHRCFTEARWHSHVLKMQRGMHPKCQPLELEQSHDSGWRSKSCLVHEILRLLDVLLEAPAEYVETSGQTTVK